MVELGAGNQFGEMDRLVSEDFVDESQLVINVSVRASCRGQPARSAL